MLKQQTVSTSLGQLTFASLNLGELRQLDALFKEAEPEEKKGITTILKYMPIVHASARKVHQDLTLEQMEAGFDLEDFNAAFDAVMSVSGLKAGARGEAQTPEAAPV